MFKLVLTTTLMVLSIAAFAKKEAQVISDLEHAKQVTCAFQASSNQYCPEDGCYRWKNYNCLAEADDSKFKVRLRIKTADIGHETVESVTYFKGL